MKYLISENRVKMGLLHSYTVNILGLVYNQYRVSYRSVKGGDGGGGNIFVFCYKRHGYMMRQL